jgi:hypothetical protein
MMNNDGIPTRTKPPTVSFESMYTANRVLNEDPAVVKMCAPGTLGDQVNHFECVPGASETSLVPNVAPTVDPTAATPVMICARLQAATL